MEKELAKKVITKDSLGKTNGYLIELFKGIDGSKTEVYLTCTNPGSFKGFHLHKIRNSRIICLKGKVKVIIYGLDKFFGTWMSQEYILDSENPERLHIPNGLALGIENIGDEEAWCVNYPNPPYDPNLKDEQIEYTKEELEGGVIK
jgi:dTDP-4-dehydrorhamnose 3,5-epimerase-like enzyme